jgi:hypothetical protein
MKHSNIDLIDCFIGIYLIYSLQGILYTSGSILSQAALLIFLLIGLSSLIKASLTKNNPKVIYVWIAFYVVNVIAFLLSEKDVYGLDVGHTSTFNQFKEISIVMLSIFVPFMSTKSNGISDKYIQSLAIIFCIYSFMRFFFSADELSASLSRDRFTNNAGYVLVCVLPYIPFLLKRNKILTSVLLLIVSVTIVISAKRGAIVCLGVSVLFSWIYYFRKNVSSIRNILLPSVLIIGLIYISYESYLSDDYLQGRIEQMEDNEGRMIIYERLWSHWVEDQNLFTMIFGNGIAQTIPIAGISAHNDWLELLIDNGLVGVILYLLIFVYLFIYVYKSSLDFYFRWSAYLCLIIWVLKTIFSMGYSDYSNAIFVMMIGFCIGQNEYITSNTRNPYHHMHY